MTLDLAAPAQLELVERCPLEVGQVAVAPVSEPVQSAVVLVASLGRASIAPEQQVRAHNLRTATEQAALLVLATAAVLPERSPVQESCDAAR